MTSAPRVKKNYDKNKALGLLQVKVWVYPEDKEKIKQYALELKKKMENKK